jgi:hypothetical protein
MVDVFFANHEQGTAVTPHYRACPIALLLIRGCVPPKATHGQFFFFLRRRRQQY